jgi:hypothetical protein
MSVIWGGNGVWRCGEQIGVDNGHLEELERCLELIRPYQNLLLSDKTAYDKSYY